MAGGGCLIQGLALLCFIAAIGTFMSIIGPIIFGLLGVVLFHYGSKKASWLECSACGGRISNTAVSVCPHCQASFIDEQAISNAEALREPTAGL
jgi:hypothetical protein